MEPFNPARFASEFTPEQAATLIAGAESWQKSIVLERMRQAFEQARNLARLGYERAPNRPPAASMADWPGARTIFANCWVWLGSSMARSKIAKRDRNRIEGGFLALPWKVLDSPSYLGLSALAKALLLDIARQYTGGNNGALLATAKVLAPRGWNSNDSITRAKAELLEAKLIYQTCMGARPNKGVGMQSPGAP